MVRNLANRRHPDAVKLSRISGAIFNGTGIILSLLYLLIAKIFGFTYIPGWIALAVFCMLFILFTWLLPTLSYRRFAYEVFEQEIEIQSGIFFIHNVLVPMIRVQHVEMESGPFMRKYGLAAVTVVTAASRHKISGLKSEDARRLQSQIAILARVKDDDDE